MTPYEISILLHYHTRRSQWNDGDFSAELCIPTLHVFCELGLLQQVDGDGLRFERGPALTTYIDAICRVPAPVQMWTLPDDRWELTEAGRAMRGGE